jgi:hypothetical protein
MMPAGAIMGDLLKNPATFLTPVLGYFIGYTYFDAYYGHYGVQLSSLDIPIEHYFTYGFYAVLRSLASYSIEDARFDLQAAVWLVLFVLAVLVLVPLKDRALQVKRFVLGVFIVVGVTLIYLLTVQVARQRADMEPEQVNIVFSQPLPEITPANEQINAPLSGVVGWSTGNQLRLISQQSDFVIVGRKRRQCQDGACEWVIWHVPAQQVRVIQVRKRGEAGSAQ